MATLQASWENPLNVIPKFTEEDKALVAAKKEKGREEAGIKAVARRFEGKIVEVRYLLAEDPGSHFFLALARYRDTSPSDFTRVLNSRTRRCIFG